MVFKSQRSRNQELFFEAATRRFSPLAHTRARSSTVAEIDTYMVWFFGAAYMGALLVENLDVFKRRWGRGSERAAFALCEVCIQPMMSIWYSNLIDQLDETEKPSQETQREVKERVFSEILTIFGTAPEGRQREGKLRRFLNLDTQWTHYLESSNGSEEQGEGAGNGIPWKYGILLSSMVDRALGGTGFIDWRAQNQMTFPLTGFQEESFCLLDPEKGLGVYGQNPSIAFEVCMVMADGARAMFRAAKHVRGRL